MSIKPDVEWWVTLVADVLTRNTAGVAKNLGKLPKFWKGESPQEADPAVLHYNQVRELVDGP